MNIPFFSRSDSSQPPETPLPQAGQRISRAEFRQLVVTRSIFYAKALEIMSTALPRTDVELHQWLEQAVAENDAVMFVHVISAAAIGGRRLPASLLVGGAALMRNEDEFSVIAWRSEGDVTGALLEAVRGGALQPKREAMALFCAAAWWKKHREAAYPAEIAGRARELARKFKNELDIISILGPLSVLIGSEELQRMASFGRSAHMRRSHVGLKDAMLNVLEVPLIEIVPEIAGRGFHRGTPLRSSVPKVERNEVCPCGSGRKYKKCCHLKDQERWRQSSDVAGLTTAELGDKLDDYLTAARLQKMEAHELARLNPQKVPTDLVSVYLRRLGSFQRYDALISAFQQLGVEGEREEDWLAAFEMPVKNWQPKVARRLLKLHPRGAKMLPELTAATRLLLAPANPGKFCRAVEKEALAALESGDPEDVRSVALGVLYSPLRALGILVARGVLPLVDDAEEIFEEILRSRDRLDLSPEDEFAGYMEEQAARPNRSKGDEAARRWQELYEIQAEETRRITEEKRKAERELALREKRARREAAANAPANVLALPASDQATVELRAKLKTLEALLRESHEKEAAALREKKKEDADKRPKEEAAAQRARVTGDDEEIQVEGNQPVRLLEFAEGFRETLAGLPRHAGRATMSRLGHLAAGEPTAFRGMKPIKAYPGVLRVRISDKYRLLFCLLPDRVRVVDLIRRGDLVPRVERLKVAGLPPVG